MQIHFILVEPAVPENVGAAARALGYINCEVAMGIPISISGKSIFYDRKTMSKKALGAAK